MLITQFVDEDFINYKAPCMFIGMPSCSMKCEVDGKFICQNRKLLEEPNHEVTSTDLILRYISNPITSAIVFGGLEPLDSFDDLVHFIMAFRYQSDDPVIIYTGYNEDEVKDKIEQLSEYSNIIVKFGRYIPGQTPHYDEVLGVNLASNNQYAVKISRQ